MRLFQNSGLYPSYLPRLNQLAAKASTFAARRDVFLHDRFGAAHFLEPVLDGAPEAFFTNGDDEVLQRGVIGPEVAFMRKPFAAEDLARRVRSLLDGAPA